MTHKDDYPTSTKGAAMFGLKLYKTIALSLLLVLLLGFETLPSIAQSEGQVTGGFVDELTSAAQTFGIINVIVMGVVVLLIVAAMKGLSPLLSALKETTERGSEAQAHFVKQVELNAEQAKIIALINERTVAALSALEPRTEAQNERKLAVEMVNKRIDEMNASTKANIQTIIERLGSIIDMLTTAETTRSSQHDAINGTLVKVTGELVTLRQVMEQLKNANDPTAVPIEELSVLAKTNDNEASAD
jgi:hypothetical protein